MIIFLLIIIAIGVLLISEPGRALLAGLVTIGFWIFIIAIGGIALIAIYYFREYTLPIIGFFAVIILFSIIVTVFREQIIKFEAWRSSMWHTHKIATILLLISGIFVLTCLIYIMTYGASHNSASMTNNSADSVCMTYDSVNDILVGEKNGVKSTTTAEMFKNYLVSTYPEGVANDGRKYSDIPAPEFVQMVISKYPCVK
ncbi:MAG: hypothetical protein M1459_00405 [Patescibacteria group bacterium]|nr:hypothetical protein [Patescibacteria group bacterium]